MKIGYVNTLRAHRPSAIGMYLVDEEEVEILMPMRYVSDELKPGDDVEVFVYTDSEDRPVAVTDMPILRCDETGFLEVTSIGTIGAFLNWGLEKDLLLPYREQIRNLNAGEKVLVSVCLDEKTNRPYASMRINRHLQKPSAELHEGDEVEVCFTRKTELGWQCIVNKSFEGLVYSNEIFKDVHSGKVSKAWVYKIRPDDKLDIRLQQWGGRGMDSNAQQLLELLNAQSNGTLDIGDKSNPEEIVQLTGMSKRNFKQAVGNLLKAGYLDSSPNSIRLKR